MTHPLRLFRERHGFTLHQVAIQVGASEASLSRIERGKQTPSTRLIALLLQYADGELSFGDFVRGAVS